MKARQYPASWRLWIVRGVGRTNGPVTVRVRADDHAAAIAKASTYGVIARDCVLLENA